MITKDKNHSHFWIESNKLYESYKTIRGLRYRLKGNINLPDTACCSGNILTRVDRAF